MRQRWFVLAVALLGTGCSLVTPTETPPTATVVITPTPSPAPSPTAAAVVPSYELSCGPLERDACLAKAVEIAANNPEKTIVAIIFMAGGSYQVDFDDGTAFMRIVD